MRFQLPKVPNIKQEVQNFRLVLPQVDSSVAPPGVRTNTVSSISYIQIPVHIAVHDSRAPCSSREG